MTVSPGDRPQDAPDELAYAWSCAEDMKGWAQRAEETNRKLRDDRAALVARVAELEAERDTWEGTSKVLGGHLAATAESLATAEARVAVLTVALQEVLEWPLPMGTVETWALPSWLARRARVALAAVSGGDDE